MKDQENRKGSVVRAWWKTAIEDRTNPRARSLAAALRRSGPAEALGYPEVHDLARRLLIQPERAARFSALVRLLAEIRQDDNDTLPQRLGGSSPVFSHLRMQRLMRAEGAELQTALRRAIIMADRRCNVAALAEDILYWGEQSRIRWWFQYFGQTSPTKKEEAEV